MTNLTQLTAERDAALAQADSYVRNDPCFRYGSGHVCFRDDLTALLLAERQLAVEEACEALEGEMKPFVIHLSPEHISRETLRLAAAFLRARLTANPVSGSLTPEETGR